MKLLIALMMLVVSVSALSSRQNLDHWYESQKKSSLVYLLDNISRPDTPVGFVVASPSKFKPNYYYHWVRDAALVMRSLDKTLEDGKFKDVLFRDYIQLVDHHQSIPSLTGLGEPKFNPDGTSYTKPWGRPQNDGPALRAITLIHYAFKLLDKGNKEFVQKHLYRNLMPARGVIKRDLEYVSHNWRAHDFCLWEEVKGHHFYTRMAQRTAMVLGAKLARRLGDHGAAKWYDQQAVHLNNALESHWSKSKGYILTTLNRVGGLDYKHSNLDTSVILAVNHSWIPGLSFGPTDKRVLKTAKALMDSFTRVYPINKNTQTGVAMGRYPEDTYFGGHPWFLLTNAMAEYYFTVAAYQKNSKAYNDLAYSFLGRVKAHMSDNGRMDEQFSKYNGFMIGARDLTWSYASFITVK